MNRKDDVEGTVNNLFNSKQETQTTGNFMLDIKNRYSFRHIHNSIMSNILNMVVSWVMSCFDKYSEKEFHQKMSGSFLYNGYYYRGFDFINDWQVNHNQKFKSIITIIRKTGVKLDKQQLFNSIIATIQKQGWNVTKEEAKCFELTVSRLYAILYL